MTQKLLKDFFGNYWSAAVFLFAVIILSIIYPVWLQTDGNSLLSWDSSGYYFYLPAFFIYNDPLHLSFAPYILETYQPTSYFYQAYKLPDGNWVMSYTMGVAMLQLPFFIIAHLIALLAGFPTDGFSIPYQFMMYVSGVFYSFLGVIFLNKALRNFVSNTIANWVICLLVLGTHWLYYATIENGMTHCYLFAGYAVLIYNTIAWHWHQRFNNLLWIAISLAFIALIRPTEAVAIIIPALWNVYSLQSLKSKLSLLRNNLSKIITAALSACFILLPQILYWKYATGKYFFNPYSYAGLGFDFLSPHIEKVLIGVQKGWLVYTPLMAFSVIVLRVLNKKEYQFMRIPVAVYFLINLYIVTSWKVWYYGGSFGMRAFIQSYAALALPFGIGLQYVFKRKGLMIVSVIFFAACIFLNNVQMLQYIYKILPSTGPSDRQYRDMFLNLRYDKIPKHKLNENGMIADDWIISKELLSSNDFEADANAVVDPDDSSNKCFKAVEGKRSINLLSMKGSKVKDLKNKWLRIKCSVKTYNEYPQFLSTASIVVNINKGGNYLQWAGQSLTPAFSKPEDYGVWKDFFSETFISEKTTAEDDIIVTLFLDGPEMFYVDNYSVELLVVK